MRQRQPTKIAFLMLSDIPLCPRQTAPRRAAFASIPFPAQLGQESTEFRLNHGCTTLLCLLSTGISVSFEREEAIYDSENAIKCRKKLRSKWKAVSGDRLKNTISKQPGSQTGRHSADADADADSARHTHAIGRNTITRETNGESRDAFAVFVFINYGHFMRFD